MHVVVVGGGITGLTVAHECLEAGASVTLVEKLDRWGGKTMSYRLDTADGRPGRPVEHSLRTFQSTYASLFETMRRIPHGHGTCFDGLRPAPTLALSVPGHPARLVPTAIRGSAGTRMRAVYRAMRDAGVSRRDVLFWLGAVGAYVLRGPAHRARLGTTSLARFLGGRSPALARFVFSFVDIVAAVKPHSSAAVALDIFARPALTARSNNPFNLSHGSNVMAGPVNETLIEPWVARLAALGARLVAGTEVVRVGPAPSGAAAGAHRVELDGGTTIAADAVVLAVPPPVLRSLLPAALVSPPVACMTPELSVGVQFHLSSLPAALAGSTGFGFAMLSPWALIWTLQAPPLWAAAILPEGIAGVLSVTASNLVTPGPLTGKPFLACTEAEVAAEVLAQLGMELGAAVAGFEVGPLARRIPHAAFLTGTDGAWRGWQAGPVGADGQVWIFCAPLWVFGPEGGARGIPVVTDRPGLFVAGEFTATYSVTPTMEKASQAGKTCAAAVLAFLGLPYGAERTARPSQGLAARL